MPRRATATPSARRLRGRLLALGVVLACRQPASPPRPVHPKSTDGRVHLDAKELPFIAVEAVGSHQSPPERELLARVALDERQVARLGSPVNGRITRVHVVTGDRVDANAALLTVRSPDLAAARTELAQANLQRVLAEKAAQRAERLFRAGAGSEAERLNADEAAAAARQAEMRARVAVRALGGRGVQGDYELRSPIAGTVVVLGATVGAEVHPDMGEPLMTIADLSRVWVLADVYEPDLTTVRTGAAVRIAFDALPDVNRDGVVAHVGEVLDPTTASARARIELDNRDGDLRPGMAARVTVLASTTDAVLIPMSAVLARRDEHFVFVQDPDGAFSQRRVDVGRHYGQHVAVKGLADGEHVVTKGAILLDVEANELF